eukprot:TRINITY_DN5653_c0_g1_i4.p1 TRINITY_DN5653_c0_g1~~TRINITY_DN5653_c0_g1_i4.p1  ORF type:complete len:232 (-),score=54.12 TRINITY_DN5653_c0_g1_i4:551-1246(-)
MIRRPPRSTLSSSSAASDVYKRQGINAEYGGLRAVAMGAYCNCGERTPVSDDAPTDAIPGETEDQPLPAKETMAARASAGPHPAPTKPIGLAGEEEADGSGRYKEPVGGGQSQADSLPRSNAVAADPPPTMGDARSSSVAGGGGDDLRPHWPGEKCTYCEQKVTNKRTSGKCANCEVAYYCSVNHQRADWKVHKYECQRLKNGERAPPDRGVAGCMGCRCKSEKSDGVTDA